MCHAVESAADLEAILDHLKLKMPLLPAYRVKVYFASCLAAFQGETTTERGL